MRLKNVAPQVQVDHVPPQEATGSLIHHNLVVTDFGLGSEEHAQRLRFFHIAELVPGRRLETQRENAVSVYRHLRTAADDFSHQRLRDGRVRTSGFKDGLFTNGFVMDTDQHGLAARRRPGRTGPEDIDREEHLFGWADRPGYSLRATDLSWGPARWPRMQNRAQAFQPVVGFEGRRDPADAAVMLRGPEEINEAILRELFDVDMEAIQPQLDLRKEALVDVLLPGVQPTPHHPRMQPGTINIFRIVVHISLGSGRAPSQGDETWRYHRTPMIPD